MVDPGGRGGHGAGANEGRPTLTLPTSRRAVLLLPLLAAACGPSPRPLRDYPPLRYDYLTKLRLNVFSIDLDEPPAPAGLLDAEAPVRPAVALRWMARDRLAPGGSSGRAVFVVDEAAITEGSGGLNGVMAVRLDVLTTEGTRAGFAEARVSRRRTGARGEDLRTALYELVREMMDDMNVEFEFQVRRGLRDWLQEASTAPAPAPVGREELATPGI